MPGQALAQAALAPLIHSPHVQHALCKVDPEDVHRWFQWTRLLWLYEFTALAPLVAHRSRAAQGAGPFHYDLPDVMTVLDQYLVAMLHVWEANIAQSILATREASCPTRAHAVTPGGHRQVGREGAPAAALLWDQRTPTGPPPPAMDSHADRTEREHEERR
jgi:hypothetical protein